MRQAILILAHKNFEQLKHLVEYFNSECDVFIHIDKKSSITKDQIQELELMPQVAKVYQKYTVHWGGYSILQAQDFLFREAFKLCDAEYFHIISGQDYPIKPLHTFLNFFEANKDKEHIVFTQLPNPRWENNSFYRFNYFFPFDLYSGDKKRIGIKVTKWIDLQKKWGIKRRRPKSFELIYGGSQWFSISRVAVEKIQKYEKKHKSFYRRLRMTFASEETYFQTLILNLCNKYTLCNKNYRYIRWHNENNNNPSNLALEHLALLQESDAFFARKMETPYCNELIDAIDRYLIRDSELTITSRGGWIYNGLLKYDLDTSLVSSIFHYCKWMGYYEILDIGCGAGLYVSSLRHLGLFAVGYDSNPFTPEISKLILPKGDMACGVADLTDELNVDSPFEVTICLNVFQYIPESLREKAVDNLVMLTKRTLIIAWDEEEDKNIKLFRENLITRGLFENKFASRYFKYASKKNRYIHVFDKKQL